MKDNIVLIGFMGTGKTTVGKLLAEKLAFSFVDMDDIIEARERRPIPEIFQTDGEAYFRRVEKNLAAELAQGQKQVISTGGGIVKDPANIAALAATGHIVGLTADIDTIFARTETRGERPVLDREQGDRRAAVAKLLAERQPLYAAADFQIDTAELTPAAIADAVIARLRQEE